MAPPPANSSVGGKQSQHKGNKQHEMAREKTAGFVHLPDNSEAEPSDRLQDKAMSLFCSNE